MDMATAKATVREMAKRVKVRKDSIMADRDKELADRFRRYLPLAMKIAHKAHRNFNIPLQDAIGMCESNLAWIVSVWYSDNRSWAYTPKEKGGCSEMTWIWRGLNQAMLDYVRRDLARHPAKRFSELNKDEESKVNLPDTHRHWLDTFLRDLGDDAREVVQIIVNAPAEILSELYNMPRRVDKVEQISGRKCGSGRAAKAVQAYLGQQGWDEGRIGKAWAEVGEALGAV